MQALTQWRKNHSIVLLIMVTLIMFHGKHAFAWPDINWIIDEYELLTSNQLNDSNSAYQQFRLTKYLLSKPNELQLALNSRRIPDNFVSNDDNTAENLHLQVILPPNFSASSNSVSWLVKPLNGANQQVKLLSGKVAKLALPRGNYHVSLTIGAFLETRVVKLQVGRKKEEIFRPKLGRIHASANEVVNWKVEHDAENRTVFQDENKRTLSLLVPQGIYQVRATLGGVTRSERIAVHSGRNTLSSIYIPAGRVNLIATQDNAPLFKPMTWDVYRLTPGERQAIGRYHRHVRAVTMPPGQYEVVARTEDVVRSRKFWVGTGTVNNVEVEMD